MGEWRPETEAQQEAVNKLQKEKKERNRRDMQAVLSTPEGRRVIRWLLYDVTGFFMVAFRGNSHDFYAEGKRAAGALLHERVIDACGHKILDQFDQELAGEVKADEAKLNKIKQMEED